MNKTALDKVQTREQSRTSGKISVWIWTVLAGLIIVFGITQCVITFSQLTHMM